MRTWSPLEDRGFFVYLSTFTGTVDLGQLWECSRAVRSVVLPNLVPRVEWGPEVLAWAHHPKRCDMTPFVKRLAGVSRMELLPPNLTQLTFDRHFNQPVAAGVLPAN